MDEFEDRLKSLALREPSNEMDARVMAMRPQPAPQLVWWRRRSPLWASAAVCASLCAVAFFAGRMSHQPEQTPAPTFAVAPPAPRPTPELEPVRVYVIYNTPENNPFDFRNAEFVNRPAIDPATIQHPNGV